MTETAGAPRYAPRHHDEVNVRVDRLAVHQRGERLDVLEPAVVAGADEHLIDGGARDLADRRDVVDA